MDLEKRIQAFIELGKKIEGMDQYEKEDLFWRAGNKNNWFTFESCSSSFEGIAHMLQEEILRHWLSAYQLDEPKKTKDIGVLMAGNIPAVGFHDLMAVLLSGNKISAKLSSADEVLMKWLINQLIEIEPGFSGLIEISEMLKNKDAYIATGSDNSARYFNYYFGKYPHLIRQNRTSVAILNGNENQEQLQKLGEDIFKYFGLGCRNVSKVYVKSPGQLTQLLDSLQSFSKLADHHKYHNNYEYNKSIYLVNSEKHLDNGFLILKESTELVSPISVLFYEFYSDEKDLKVKLERLQDKIQCIVTENDGWKNAVPFGKAQMPDPWDYADGVDTLRFLGNLEN
ncbi:acyl-CoA reductase [Algoriphagus sp. CAU 1675]|uniref:acyl-CoA reductase n=1 Tax=Algoriphagus sp. CAU 1675 TaxID=3032597 RepID=UPI0023DBC384|nr:acyl-CoA reductase [Algoriphagus sp. CAU 1675]MDF2158171.1 acyl-CoA reductase [Algoriphagus sp. CAU 1675]